MSKIVIEIDTGSAAFEERPEPKETASILGCLAARMIMIKRKFVADDSMELMDSNGISVGSITFTVE